MTSIIFMLLGCSFMSKMMSAEILGFLIFFMIMMGVNFMGGMSWKFSILSGGVGIDIISYSMVLLTLFLGVLMLFGDFKIKDVNMFKILVIMISLFLIYAFLNLNMLGFYLFFELVLVPMLLLIFIYGYQPERLESGIYMIMYTMFGSLPLLMGLMSMWSGNSSLKIFYIVCMKGDFMFLNWGWLMLLGFLVKLPMYGLHIWLPKAHVEASVGGSSILAGILLKLGCYGFYRVYLLMNFKLMSSFFMMMGLWGSMISVMLCFYQMDMKKLIAYSSVMHMGLFLSGVTSMSSLGMLGGLMMMIGHGLCSSGLFYFVNLLYSQVHSRSLLMMKGLLGSNPKGSMWGFLLVISNSAAPPFLNFFSEISLCMGVLSMDLILSLILFIIFFSSVGYSIYFYSVIAHGGGNFFKFVEMKVEEYYIMFMHFWPNLGLIFLMKFMVSV